MAGYHPGEPTQFADGSWGFQPHWGWITLAWLVDTLIVFGIAVALLGAASSSQAVGNDEAWLLLALTGLSVPWLLGFLCFSGYTPGSLICGTRLVRIGNGRAPGFWRGGWLMFQRTIMVPLAALWMVSVAINGSFDTGWIRRFHVSINPRRTASLRNGTWRP
ncbi:RDD family protein [Paeniglutamicibacter cryotolerans]|uniref:RDD family protein n=1 Tax=Paeniglutamicibacter cryotolerans TaxID=670079 RepID=A0A839QFD9_9MICC|nr:RDD family protein [Paeniglutamicibacter cryotolerans]MBB2994998.1 hypothetical protein [Paeniglutamicibacter cryotolerans]